MHLPKGSLGLTALPAAFGLPQFTIDGRQQPGEVALGDEIVGSGLEGGHRNIFPDGSGHQDEGNVDASPLEKLQGVHPIEARQGVIRDDQIPEGVRKGLGHGFRGIHAMAGNP